jgi:hypothetical protein
MFQLAGLATSASNLAKLKKFSSFNCILQT